MTSKPPKTSTNPRKRTPEDVVRAVASKLEAAFDGLEIHGDGEHKSTVMDLTALGRELVRACDSLRQFEKATERAVASIPLELIIAHLKTLDLEKRQHLCMEILGDEDTRSIL